MLEKQYVIITAFVLLLVLQSINVKAQNSVHDSLKIVQPTSISFLYQKGYVFPTNDFVRGNNAKNDIIDDFQTFATRITKQTLGDHLWQQLYHYPEYGLGIYVAEFYNPEEIGMPIAFYSYYNAPFYRWKRFT